MSSLLKTFQYQFILPLMLVLLSGCASNPEGVEFDTWLIIKEDGLVYTKAEDKLYTGKAYDSVCRSCMPFIHWQGEFRDGKRHGAFVFPLSRDPNGSFRPGDEHVVRVKFENGIEVANSN